MAFIKVDRGLPDWQWFNKDKMLQFWIYLLCKAAYKDCYVNGTELKKGQVIIGKKNVAEKLNISEQNIKTYIKRLISTNEITIKSTNKFTIITIVKWEDYQCITQTINQQNNQATNFQLTNNQPTTNQQLTTIKEIKEQKEVKESLIIDKIDVENPVEILENEMLENDLSYSLENCNPIDYFETEFGRPISQMEVMRIGQMISENGQLLVMYALREALTYEKKNVDYIDRILYNWKEQEFTTNDYEKGKR